MGYWSDRAINMTEEGMNLFAVEDEAACPACFEDEALQKRVRDLAKPAVCSYCGSEGKGAAAMEDIVSIITRSLQQEWARADEGLPFDKEKGDFLLAPTYLTEEVLDAIGLELPNDGDGRLRRDLVRALPDQTWSVIDPLIAAPHEAITNSWRSFCHVIKHERRFYFRDYMPRDLADDLEQQEAAYSIPELLDEVAGYVARTGLYLTVPAGTRYIRAMERKDSAAAPFGPRRMGPPPVELAKQPNRMSPAGIPMFYGAEAASTALRESTREPGRFALGTFELLKDRQLLDLRRTPQVPSLFDEAHAQDRAFARFMREFIGDFRRPIDEAAEVEYVPTQVVTEYFRAVVHGDRAIDGVLYASTRDADRTAVVLFADTFDVEEPGSGPVWRRDPPSLRMVAYEEVDFDPLG